MEIDRPEEEERLEKVLKPRSPVESYELITGEHGTGYHFFLLSEHRNNVLPRKSYLTWKTAKNLGSGVIYVSVPEETRLFPLVLADALGFSFNEHITFSERLTRRLLGEPSQGW